ncbi:hypothetical protein ABZ719_17515 [Streptomyces sp. NPDC006743]|uniref:hypothetical protein n=1 Tax=Streptomyces sp. NPDC006743 TaxID=3154480 RepID=UPI0034511A4B
MSGQALDPDEIPEFTGNLDQLDKDVSAIGTDAAALWDAGARIDSTFNSLSAYYKAPEAEKLFATTKPVAAAGDELCDELGTVASALAAYADEVRPLVATLDRLRQEARAFRASVAHDDDWQEDGDKVEENNDRRSQVDATWAAFQAAERDCHAKIVKLVGGDPLTVDDGSHKKGMYGYRAEDLDQAQGLPWGDPVDEETPWYRIDQHAWNFVKGFFVDGVWGTIRGLGTLVGVDGWDAAGQAWKGLGQLLTGIALTVVAPAAYWTADDDQLPTWLRESRRAVKETGKALLAWDEWGKNPARAAGAVTFNVVTTVLTGGAGTAAKTGSIAKAISLAGKAGRVVDPMTYVAKAAGLGLTKVGDVMASLRGVTKGTYVELAGRTYEIVDQPLAREELPAGLSPENSVRMEHAGRVVYLDTRTMVLRNADGTVRQSLDDMAREGSARERAAEAHDGSAGVPEHQPVGVHGGEGGRPPHTGTDGAGGSGRDVQGGHGTGGALPDHGGPSGPDQMQNVPGHGDRSGAAGPPSGGRRPDFMREGAHPYGPRGTLTREQIEDIQVYRANHEPGYFEHYYRKDGTRKSLSLYDESGYTPPQLTRWGDGAPLIRAKDVPEPPAPHFLDDGYIRVGADTVTDRSRLDLLRKAALDRHLAIQWDNLISEWKAETGRAHEMHGTIDTAAQWGEAKGAYRESHTVMGDATEVFGEQTAEYHYIAERYPDFEKQPLLGPKNGNDQFDQVWTHEDGRVVVVEAKSSTGTELGRRTLATGRQVSQGSREYFDDIIRVMRKRGEFELVADIRRAMKEGKLEYVVVKGEKNAGIYSGYQYRRFDISKGTLS